MTKSKQRAKLTMHKIIGDHKMVNKTLCEECGITEGEEIIDKYQPVHMGPDEVKELVMAVLKLADRVRELEGKFLMKPQPYPTQPMPMPTIPTPIGPYYSPNYSPNIKPLPYEVTWGGTSAGSTSGKAIGGGNISKGFTESEWKEIQKVMDDHAKEEAEKETL